MILYTKNYLNMEMLNSSGVKKNIGIKEEMALLDLDIEES